jgi:hypothetical protein
MEGIVVVLRNDFWRLLILRIVDVACVGGTTMKGILMKFMTWNERQMQTGFPE